MPRALWRGAIAFGLVYIPVELHSASRENTLPLHLLDSRDFAPVGFARINKVTGKEVDWSHIVKGYEYKKGDYVALTESDFKRANVKASETIEIDAFCDASEVPPPYYEKPYYLRPAKGAGKVYSLLRQALDSSGKIAIATFVMHQRQHFCVLAPQGTVIVLQTLRFDDELDPLQEARVESMKVSAAELATAKQLLQSMTAKFSPARFKDSYRADLKRRVQEKIRKKATHSLAAESVEDGARPKAQVIDLMQALKASLAKGGRRPAPRRKRA